MSGSGVQPLLEVARPIASCELKLAGLAGGAVIATMVGV
jgi:hypothetical protein